MSPIRRAGQRKRQGEEERVSRGPPVSCLSHPVPSRADWSSPLAPLVHPRDVIIDANICQMNS